MKKRRFILIPLLLLTIVALFFCIQWLTQTTPNRQSAAFEQSVIDPTSMSSERHYGAISKKVFLEYAQKLNTYCEVKEEKTKSIKILKAGNIDQKKFNRAFFNTDDPNKYEILEGQPLTIINDGKQYGFEVKVDAENNDYVILPYDVLMAMVREVER